MWNSLVCPSFGMCAQLLCVVCVCVSHVFFFLLLILIYCLVVHAFLAFTRRRMHNMFWHGPRRSMRQCKTMAHMCLSVYYQHWLHCFSRSPVVMYSLIKTYTMHFDCDLCAHFSLICLLLLYSFFVSTLSLSLSLTLLRILLEGNRHMSLALMANFKQSKWHMKQDRTREWQTTHT